MTVKGHLHAIWSEVFASTEMICNRLTTKFDGNIEQSDDAAKCDTLPFISFISFSLGNKI